MKYEISKTFDKDLNDIKQGDIIEVKINYRGLNTTSEDLVILDILPGGFELINDETYGSASRYIDEREDRIMAYVKAGSSAESLTYKMKAVFVGKYKVPPAYIEDMYQLDHKALSEGNIIEIKKFKK